MKMVIFSCDQAALWMVFYVRLSVIPFSLCSHHHKMIMKFSGVITNDQSEVHAKGQDQRSKVKVTEVKTQLNRFRTVTSVWIHIWWWMMHKAWCCLEDVPYCFSMSSVKFQGHMAKKIVDFDSNLAFLDCNSSLIHQWLRNDVQLIFKVIRQISRSHGTKNADFDPNWSFPDCSSSLNLPMAIKWWTKLEAA